MGANPAAGRREWLGLAVLALPTLLLSIDLSVLHLALPQLSEDLRPTGSQQLWIMDIYGFMMAGFLITMGTLGDRTGRRRMLLAGAVAFALASTLAAFSVNAEMLVATRALMGVAGAMVMPSTLALLTTMFQDPRQRGLAISVWISCFMSGTAIGPLVGGAMLASFWWGSVFLLGVPVMAVLLVAGPVLLPEHRNPGAGRLDLVSVALSLAAVLPVIYGIKEFARDGLRADALVALLAGLAFGVVFVRRQRSLADPLLDVRLFGNRSFSTALGVMLLSTATMGGVGLLVNQHLQMVIGLSPLSAGLWLVPPAVGSIVGSMLAPQLVRRIRLAFVAGGGLVVAGGGLLLLTQVGTSGLALLVSGFTLLFFGFGAVAALGNDLVVGSAPQERAGSAAAIVSISSEFGIATGVAVLGSVGAAVYRGQMADAALPPGVSSEARDTLAGATVAAGGDSSSVVLVAAREAFASGLHVVAGIAAAVLVGIAVVAGIVLRNLGHAQAPTAPEVSDPTEPADPAKASNEQTAATT